jgi:hypothetical protein
MFRLIIWYIFQALQLFVYLAVVILTVKEACSVVLLFLHLFIRCSQSFNSYRLIFVIIHSFHLIEPKLFKVTLEISYQEFHLFSRVFLFFLHLIFIINIHLNIHFLINPYRFLNFLFHFNTISFICFNFQFLITVNLFIEFIFAKFVLNSQF